MKISVLQTKSIYTKIQVLTYIKVFIELLQKVRMLTLPQAGRLDQVGEHLLKVGIFVVQHVGFHSPVLRPKPGIGKLWPVGQINQPPVFIQFHWHPITLICLCDVYDCFRARAELNSSNRNYTACKADNF